MPYIITKKNGKKWDWPSWARPFPSNVVGEYARDGKAVGDCWTLTNTVTRRTINVGACKRETPADLWGGAGFLDKLFGKKKPKRHPMSRRVYMVRTPSGRMVEAGPAMHGARRRRRRRR